MASVKQDNKGSSFYISHKRCGVTEGTFFTLEELVEIRDQINEILDYERERLRYSYPEAAG
jgi:hypothetical protein